MALRGLLHFDLLRGFAPSYLRGANQAAIPYVEEVTNKPVAQLTVAEVIDKVIGDVETARKLIREVDPIGPTRDSYTESGYETEDYIQGDGFWLYRKSRLNYYGMTALRKLWNVQRRLSIRKSLLCWRNHNCYRIRRGGIYVVKTSIYLPCTCIIWKRGGRTCILAKKVP